MVIVGLSGGIGNQIIEYAVGRGVAAARNDYPAIDASWYHYSSKMQHERFMLNAYSLKYGEQVKEEDLYRVTGCLLPTGRFAKAKFCYNALQHRRNIWGIFPRRNVLYYPQLLETWHSGEPIGDIEILGYPFDYTFFKEISSELRKEFIPKDIDPLIRAQAAAMDKNSISVHVRIQDDGRIPGSAYYEKAADYMSGRINDPVFYIFSNHVELAEKIIKFSGKLVFIPRGDAAQDLYLMSRCAHHIIAESTYSWCGAWLSAAEGKDITYPAHWGSATRAPVLVPGDWTPFEGMSYEH